MGEVALWGPAENMLAATVDLLQSGNWQRGGNKNAPRPKPWPRPGQTQPGRKQFGNQKLTVDQYHERMRRRRGRRAEPSPSNSPPATSP
jgi:hypothetical protein